DAMTTSGDARAQVYQKLYSAGKIWVRSERHREEIAGILAGARAAFAGGAPRTEQAQDRVRWRQPAARWRRPSPELAAQRWATAWCWRHCSKVRRNAAGPKAARQPCPPMPSSSSPPGSALLLLMPR